MFTIGQEVWLKTIGNLARGGSDNYPGWVQKVGKKYVYVARKENEECESFWIKINLENFREQSNFSSNWRLFLSEQHFLDEQERERLYDKIQTAFSGYGRKDYPLEKLRGIAAILFE